MFDSDRSLSNSPKDYIDPWDLENYAYIKQHLDSMDLNSDPSSSGESSDLYYQRKPTSSGFPQRKQFDSYESYNGCYAAIEEIMESYKPQPVRATGNSRRRSECVYKTQSYRDKDGKDIYHTILLTI